MDNIKVNLNHKNYSILLQKGILNDVGNNLKELAKGKNVAVITDTNVYELHGKKLKKSLEKSDFLVNFIVIKPGEKSKSVEVLLFIYNQLLDYGITRNDLIIAFGGGVVGDIAGFAAATFLRGVPFVQIPTTLLAQVDSSMGGKVAINLERGKNLVGNFYHPEIVFIDTELLNTLNRKVLYDGVSEVIKYGCIKEPSILFNLYNFKDKDTLLNNIEGIIFCCCNIKNELVEKDERDNDARMLLNFGHTIGHAIERYFHYEKYTHGEAVAIGMHSITRKCESLGITEEGTSEFLKQLLLKYDLPFELYDIDRNKITEIIKFDKKSSANKLNIILIRKFGDSFIKQIERSDVGWYL